MAALANATWIDPSRPEGLAELEGYVHRRLGNRVRHLELDLRPEGLVIMGQAATYYAKQLAQEMAMDACQTPVINAIEVCPQRPH
jgi:hypothetical protein